jgi:MFS transporter, MHS family, proline/betaine transporter
MVGEVAGARIVATPMTMRAISAAGIGNLLEWYDWSVYVVLARQIGAVFFPSDNPLKETLSPFLFYGVGFLMRPVGAIVIGHLGDKFGRKNALVFTVMAMALGTFMIGCLPSHAQMGSLGPVLLVAARLLQGFSAGGEWGGSTSFIAEYAPEGKRGFMASFQQVTTVGGLLIGTVFGFVLTVVLTPEQLLAWGWRVPFLAGILLAFVGVYLRAKVDETPKYAEIEAKRAVAQAPFLEMLRTYPKETATAFCFTPLWTVGFYIVLTYMPTFMVQQLKLPASQSLLATSLGQLLMAVLIPFSGALSDRIGRRPLLIAACAIFVVGIIPAFKFIVAVPEFWAVLANQLFWAIPLSFYSGAGPAAIAEIFPTKVRYVALSTGYGTAVAIFGGFANWFANTLIEVTGDPISPSYYVIAAAIASLITMICIEETYNKPLR